ncbi:hypothetical protein P364_0107555 [Paenibacillus sp. MAEPY2]|nr:hypothetical protein P364_0107555 [Paenibacillus sp. MAEPY2]KGP86282.1 hypothetical protein P363_0118570 [Paenibacillus sp. MAEPY1]
MFLLPMLLLTLLSIPHWQRSTEKILEPQVAEGDSPRRLPIAPSFAEKQQKPLAIAGMEGANSTSSETQNATDITLSVAFLYIRSMRRAQCIGDRETFSSKSIIEVEFS